MINTYWYWSRCNGKQHVDLILLFYVCMNQESSQQWPDWSTVMASPSEPLLTAWLRTCSRFGDTAWKKFFQAPGLHTPGLWFLQGFGWENSAGTGSAHVPWWGPLVPVRAIGLSSVFGKKLEPKQCGWFALPQVHSHSVDWKEHVKYKHVFHKSFYINVECFVLCTCNLLPTFTNTFSWTCWFHACKDCFWFFF